jgi:GLPGLI family protein
MSFSALAQSFEGKITVQSKILDAPAEMESMKSMMETTMTSWMKGSKSRMETSSPFMGKTITISDFDKKETVTCVDMMGQKRAIIGKMGDATQGKQQAMKADIQYKETGKTKTILGYTCHEALGTYQSPEGKQLQMSVWYSKELPNRNTEYHTLSGMPLEYSMQMQGMTMQMTTTSITPESVSDEMFVIPAGYTPTTQEEMMKNAHGMGGHK